ncbi:metal transporter [Candidatus Magnetoovum chiemensis]|nr:metal transporter [Candidatus Magnetoovum chiemensis]
MQHSHRFCIENRQGEKNTRRVIVLTAIMTAVEVAAGIVYGSMALLADGWHMSTHAAALAITAFSYYYERKHIDNPSYTFGTGKVNALSGFASAVVLALIAFIMAAESFGRIIHPIGIHFNEAILVAFIGLTVNIISMFLLEGHDNEHDHNLKAAYWHVMADSLTSVLALIALFTGKIFGWLWLDPVMGIVGALIIIRWAYGLLNNTSAVLLDRDVELHKIEEIKTLIEKDGNNKVIDIHVWRVGHCHLAAILSILTHHPKPPEHYKNMLSDYKDIVHVTVEVNMVK